MASQPRPQQPRQQPQQPLVVTDVRLEQVGRSGSTLKGRIAATAKKGNNPWSGVDINFKVGGVQTQNSPLQSGEDGSANDDFEIPLDPATSRVLIEAYTPGSNPVRKFIDVATAIKPPTVKKALDKIGLVATDSGDGNWAISIAAWMQDSSPATDVAIEVSHAGNIESVTTDKSGFARHRVKVTGRKSIVSFQAPGVQKSLVLYGPKNKEHRKNNVYLGILWIFAILWLTGIAATDYFYLTPPVTQFSEFSDEGQKALNLYMNGEVKTDHEMIGWNKPDPNYLNKFWTIGWVSILMALVFTPIALREEFIRAWTIAWSNTQAWVDKPDEPKTPPTTGSGTRTEEKVVSKKDQIFKQMYLFSRELLSAVIAELAVGERKIMR